MYGDKTVVICKLCNEKVKNRILLFKRHLKDKHKINIPEVDLWNQDIKYIKDIVETNNRSDFYG